jgi:hypothetical protein
MGLTSAVGLFIVAAVTAGPVDSRSNDDRELSQRVQSLVAHINENHDPLHSEVTSAGVDLIELGLPALRHGALELIVSDDEHTRHRGEFVLAGIVQEAFGVSGQGYLNSRRWERFQQFWMSLGNYDPDMAEPERRKCYEQWKEWVATTEELTPSRDPNRLRPPQVDPPQTTAP